MCLTSPKKIFANWASSKQARSWTNITDIGIFTTFEPYLLDCSSWLLHLLCQDKEIHKPANKLTSIFWERKCVLCLKGHASMNFNVKLLCIANCLLRGHKNYPNFLAKYWHLYRVQECCQTIPSYPPHMAKQHRRWNTKVLQRALRCIFTVFHSAVTPLYSLLHPS